MKSVELDLIKELFLQCWMSNTTWACCSSLNPCEEAEGDCDNDYDCLGNLKCGKNNCHPPFDEDADCCYDPSSFRKEIFPLWGIQKGYPIFG